jgi:hypothetical protein
MADVLCFFIFYANLKYLSGNFPAAHSIPYTEHSVEIAVGTRTIIGAYRGLCGEYKEITSSYVRISVYYYSTSINNGRKRGHLERCMSFPTQISRSILQQGSGVRYNDLRSPTTWLNPYVGVLAEDTIRCSA